MLTNGIRPRRGAKKREYQCRRQNAIWTPSSSSMSTLGGDQMAPSVLASCRGCLHTQKRWDGGSTNELLVKAASDWSLGWVERQKLWPSRWWDSGPPGRRSEGSIMRYTNKGGYQAPHCMIQSRWKTLIGKSTLPWKSGHGGGGVLPGQKRI